MRARTLSTGLLWLAGTASIVALAAVVAAFARSGTVALAWNVAWTAAALAALAGALAARASATDRARRRWTWWAAACASWLAGQLAWDTFALGVTPPSPNLADAGWWAFAVLVVVGVFADRAASRTLRWLAVIEGLPLVAAVMAVTCAWLWEDVAASSLPLLSRATTLIYPVLYVSAAVLTLQAMVAGSLRAVRAPGLGLVLTGVMASALGFILWSPQLLAERYVPGATLLDVLWVAGMLLIAAGGALATLGGEADATAPRDPARWGGVLPGAVFVLLVAGLIHTELTDAPLGARLSLTVGLLTCGALLVGRARLLSARMRSLLERERAARNELAGREAELARLNERLAEDSRRDPLTGLLNRRALSADLDWRGAGEPMAFALCDVDRFKSYNDRLGHLAGDQALRRLAATIAGLLRGGDAAYRFGGEELLLVLRGADADQAHAVGERVRAAVEAEAWPHPDGIGGIVTVSVGVAAGDAGPERLLAEADAALYDAKAGGRNRVAGVGEAAPRATRPRAPRPVPIDEPVLRHLRGVLAIGRAAATGRGRIAVLQALAQVIRSELSFDTVAVNLRDADRLRTVLVLGDEEARAALEGTTSSWEAWSELLDPRHERGGAIWLPAGSHPLEDGIPTWVPERSAAGVPGGWDPEDQLFLPLRASTGAVVGVVSVDQPRSGRRPDDNELGLLMAVADHAAVALEHIEREEALLGAAADARPEDRLAAVMLLAETLDLRDGSTSRHSQTVGAYARDIAAALGLAPHHVERLHAAGVLHDLGKLGISDAILRKPGALTEDEWREMKGHPEIGARILARSGLADIAAWVKAHHERLDGRGYPLGLAGDEIPLEARILAVADAYEAMTADRPYRAGMPAEEANEELRRCAGTQFDAAVVEAFLGASARALSPAR